MEDEGSDVRAHSEAIPCLRPISRLPIWRLQHTALTAPSARAPNQSCRLHAPSPCRASLAGRWNWEPSPGDLLCDGDGAGRP